MQPTSALCWALRLLAILAMAATCCRGQLDVPDDYLLLRDRLPLAESPFRSELLEMMKQHPLEADASTAEMLRIIKRTRDTTKDLKEMDFFEELLDLSAPGDKCTPNARTYVLAVLSLAQETHERAVQGYLAYVKRAAKEKWGACAQKTAEEFQRVQGRLDLKVEEALDELFMAYIDAKHVLEDLDLYQAAKKMNFVTDNYKVRRMLKVSERFMPPSRTLSEAPRKSSVQLGNFIPGWCQRMQEPLKQVFAVFNLARALGAQMTTGVPVRFLKLNEYNRVCLTWLKNPQAAEANLESQLRATRWCKLKGGSSCM